jgi:hypothetical protein
MGLGKKTSLLLSLKALGGEARGRLPFPTQPILDSLDFGFFQFSILILDFGLPRS